MSRSLVITAVLMSATPAWAQTNAPATRPAINLADDDTNRLGVLARFAMLPMLAPGRLGEVVRIVPEGDFLAVLTRLPETEFPSRLPLTGGDPALVSAVVLGVQEEPSALRAPEQFQLIVYRHDLPGYRYFRVELLGSSRAGTFQVVVNAQSDSGPDRSLDRHIEVTLLQRPGLHHDPDADPTDNLRFTVQERVGEDGEVVNGFSFNARSLAALRRARPAEVNRFLRPAFRLLGQETPHFTADLAAAWQVLGAFDTVNPAVLTRLKSLLADLDADAFRTREAAAESLRALGAEGARAARTLDRSALTPNQNEQIDALLAPFSPLSTEDAARLADSTDFLLDALDVDDARLRAVAWHRLRMLTRTDLPFSPDAGPDTRAAELDRLRLSLTPATRPAGARASDPAGTK